MVEAIASIIIRMSDHYISGIVAILMAVVGVAILAVLVSKQAQTSSVLGAGATGFGNALCVALSPITGGNCGGSQIEQVTSSISF